jgi:SecD/SecF fusion protein
MSLFTNPVAVNLLLLVGLPVVSFFLGGYLARALRMRDYGWKFSVILLAILAGGTEVYRGWPPKLGVDLGGGAILVYQLDPDKIPPGGVERETMDKMVTSISERVNPGGQKEIMVRPLGSDKIQITMPEVGTGESEKERQAEAAQIKRIISRSGSMVFRIVANTVDHRSLIDQAMAEPKRNEVKDSQGRVMAEWVPIKAAEVGGLVGDPKLATRTKNGRVEALVVTDPYDVTGDYLRQSTAGVDEGGRPAVHFSFNGQGARLFERLTGDNVPTEGFKRHLAIILDDELQSAPTINSVISDSGQISGSFKQSEVEELVRVLNAGALPATLIKEPVRDMSTGPTLGGDTIRKSANAMIVSSIVVPLFMIWYYRFAGLVAVAALGLNMLLLVAVMILVKAPFTLPALAGLALTVGMDVDNNVLIYERLREELAHGAALRMAIRNAFHRAGVVIVDANITHLIAATVLFAVGTEQVKGFAVTFWLGAVLSIWATMFVARVVFEVFERKQWITRIHMLHIIGHTEIDFMSWFPAAATFSVLITVVGLGIAVHRGVGLFDIDFTGGVSVQTLFTKPHQDIAKIRKAVAHLPDVAVSNAQVQGEAEGQRFIIDTSEADANKVKQDLKKIFDDSLISNEVAVTSVTTIPAVAPATGKGPLPEKATLVEPEEKPMSEPAKAAKPAPAQPPAKAAEMTPAKPAPKAADKPAPKAADKPVEKPAGNVPPTKPQSRLDLPADNVVALAGPAPILVALADQPAAKPAQQPVQQPPQKAADKPPATPATKPADQAATRPTAKAVEKPAARPAENAPEPSGYVGTPPTGTEPSAPAAPAVDPLAGGTQAELKFQFKVDHRAAEEQIKKALTAHGLNAETIPLELTNATYVDRDPTAYDTWTLRIKLPPEKMKPVLDTLREQIRTLPYFPDVDAIGGAVASDTRYYAVVALVSSWVLIILYLWIRFQGVAFGLAAVIALIHDVLVMLGAIAFSYYVPTWLGNITLIEPFKINLPIVAAFLTIIGYSVNDTIVVFDRIREVRGKDPRMTRQMINDSTNQTLSRTLLTSFTVLLVVCILYAIGGQAVHGFAFALIIGVMTGTYSSIYVAAPILLWLIHPAEMKKPGRE